MAFVRTKRVGNYEYYQLVESIRVDGKPRQKVLVHLNGHPTVDEALKEWPQEIRELRRDAATKRESATKSRETSRHHHREMLERATGAEKRADSLAASLKKLRNLRKQDIV